MVLIAHQRLWGIDSKDMDCASLSKRYITVPENTSKMLSTTSAAKIEPP